MNKTEKTNKIADVIYDELAYTYCNNCRFNSEVLEEDCGYEEYSKYKGSWGCEDCHRKYMGWEVSKAAAKRIAKRILKEMEEK